jgi:hypothetical protein
MDGSGSERWEPVEVWIPNGRACDSRRPGRRRRLGCHWILTEVTAGTLSSHEPAQQDSLQRSVLLNHTYLPLVCNDACLAKL